jgi:hypothetical protein
MTIPAEVHYLGHPRDQDCSPGSGKSAYVN